MNGLGGSSTVKPSEEKVRSRPEAAHSIDLFPVEANMVYYDTLQEFFGLPQNVEPVMYNGQLMYRDGATVHSSKVTKAQAYFPPGLDG